MASTSGRGHAGLAPPEDSESFLVGPTGLRIKDAPDFDTWAEAGTRLRRIAESFSWCLGDWLVFGQHRYPERYRTAIDAAGLDYQTLRNYASVARRVAPERRRRELSFQHHAEVAGLPDEEQSRWLSAAHSQGWSRNQLRQHLRTDRSRAGHNDSSAVSSPGDTPSLHVSSERAELWRRAAEHRSETLETWMTEALDRAARRQLDL